MVIIKYLISSFKKIFQGKRRILRRPKARKRKPSRVSSPRNNSAKKKHPQVLKPGTKDLKKNSPSNSLPDQGREVILGDITHYFSRIQVVVARLKQDLNIGDNVQIRGKSTSFKQKIGSMQIESVDVKRAKKGQLIGIKVIKEARPGDKIYQIS